MHLVIISLNDIFLKRLCRNNWKHANIFIIPNIYRPQTKFGARCAIPSVQVGVCVAGGGHAWQGGAWWGVGMRGGGVTWGEGAWQEWRPRSGRYASYWKAFLCYIICVLCVVLIKKWKKRGKLFTRKHAYRLLCLTIATRCHHWGTLYSEVFKWTSVTGIQSWLPEVTSGGEGPCTVRSHVWRGNLNSEFASWVMVTWWPSPPTHRHTRLAAG